MQLITRHRHIVVPPILMRMSDTGMAYYLCGTPVAGADAPVGDAVGEDVGASVGEDVGAAVGDDVGASVGEDVGASVGEDVGAAVGLVVISIAPLLQ